MNYYNLNIHEYICIQISFQYHKTVTFNISVSQSSAPVIHGTATPSDLPPAIERKISSISYDNATWHKDLLKQDPSATSCMKSQTRYLCIKAHLKHTNISEYI